MDQFLNILLTTFTPLLSAVVGFLISYFNSKKQIEELKQSKTALEKAIVDNSYIVCPSCKRVIYLKDVEFKKEGDQSNEIQS